MWITPQNTGKISRESWKGKRFLVPKGSCSEGIFQAVHPVIVVLPIERRACVK